MQWGGAKRSGQETDAEGQVRGTGVRRGEKEDGEAKKQGRREMKCGDRQSETEEMRLQQGTVSWGLRNP